MPKELTVVTDMKAAEVSLVKQGANRKKRFPIFKSEESMNPEILKAVLETEVDVEKQLEEIFAKAELTDKGKAAAAAAVRLLNSFKDELPPGIIDKLVSISGVKGEADKAKNPMEDEEEMEAKKAKAKKAKKAEDEEDEDSKKPPFLKSGDGEGEAMSEDMKKELAERDTQLEELRKQNETFQAQLTKEKDARELSEWIEKARAELAHYPGKSVEEMGAMLKGLNDMDQSVAVAQFESMKAASLAMKDNAILKNAGGMGGGGANDSAMAKIEKAAEGIIEKSSTIVTKQQAIAKALDMNPELYSAYLADNPKQTEA